MRRLRGIRDVSNASKVAKVIIAHSESVGIGTDTAAAAGDPPMKLPMATGLIPADTVATTVLVAVLITETLPLPTYQAHHTSAS